MFRHSLDWLFSQLIIDPSPPVLVIPAVGSGELLMAPTKKKEGSKEGKSGRTSEENQERFVTSNVAVLADANSRQPGHTLQHPEEAIDRSKQDGSLLSELRKFTRRGRDGDLS